MQLHYYRIDYINKVRANKWCKIFRHRNKEDSRLDILSMKEVNLKEKCYLGIMMILHINDCSKIDLSFISTTYIEFSF